MSRDILPCSGPLGLVVPGRIQRERPQELPVLRDDPDVQIGHQHEDPHAGVSSPQPDVVQPAVVAKGDDPTGVDAVPPDPAVARGDPARVPRGRGVPDGGTRIT